MSWQAYAEYLRGKRVVVVGPAGYMTGLGQGPAIDAYDVVVRLNLDCPVRPDVFRRLYPDKTPSEPADIGTRTDVLYHTLFDERLAQAAGQDHTPEQAAAWREDGVQWAVSRQAEGTPRVQRLRAALGDVLPLLPLEREWYQALKRRVGTAPNMGVVAIAHLLEQPVRSVHVTGMSFLIPWEGYRVGYGGFDAEQAGRGDGAGHWGQDPHMRIVPHDQAPQHLFLQQLYRADPRLTFDETPARSLGLVEEPSVTALLPVKAYSERVPGKNTRELNGRPLFEWVLDTLHAAKRVSRVVLATDSDRIAEAAVRLHPRTEVLRQGEAVSAETMNAVIAHHLPALGAEHILQTHATNPLLRPETVDAAVGQYFERLDEHDSLFAVTEHRVRLYRADATPVGHDPGRLERSQDLEPLYEDNSNLYVFSRASFEAAGGRIGQSPQMYVMGRVEALDIDYEDDFRLADAAMRMRDLGPVATRTERHMTVELNSTRRLPGGDWLVRGRVDGHSVSIRKALGDDPSVKDCLDALRAAGTPGTGHGRPAEPPASAPSPEPEARGLALLDGSAREVVAAIDALEDPHQLAALLAAERARRKPRVTVVAAIEGRLAGAGT